MADTALLIGGTLSVGESASPDFTVSPTIDGGTITESNKQKTVIAYHATTTTALTFPAGITNASLLWVRGKDSSGVAKRFQLVIDGATLPEMTEILISNKAPSAKFQAVHVLNDLATTGALTLDYVIAG